MNPLIKRLIDAVAALEGVTSAPHRFGGVEWRVEGSEIGHIHPNGMLDILYSKAVRERLVADGLTGLHHILPETGWTTFYIRSEEDVERALWLVTLSYVQKAVRKMPERDFGPVIEHLKIDDSLLALITRRKKSEPDED
jgi:luciferase-like monooxygenase